MNSDVNVNMLLPLKGGGGCTGHDGLRAFVLRGIRPVWCERGRNVPLCLGTGRFILGPSPDHRGSWKLQQ